MYDDRWFSQDATADALFPQSGISSEKGLCMNLFQNIKKNCYKQACEQSEIGMTQR